MHSLQLPRHLFITLKSMRIDINYYNDHKDRKFSLKNQTRFFSSLEVSIYIYSNILGKCIHYYNNVIHGDD